MPSRRVLLVVLTPAMSLRLLADVVVAIHALYVAFVVLGLVAISIGYARAGDWVRNRYFRLFHLAAIGLVCVESIVGIDVLLPRWKTLCVWARVKMVMVLISSATGRTG